MKKKKLNNSIYLTVLLLFFYSQTQAQEIHTQSNAANATNESATITGWTKSSGTLVASSDEQYTGSHSLKITTTNTASWTRAIYNFDVELGEEYIIKIHAKSDAPERPGFWAFQGFSNFTGQEITNEWAEYTFNLTADATTAAVLIYPGLPSNPGDTVYIDNVSIVKASDQTTTTGSLWTQSGDDIFFIGGRVGVGATPGYKFQVNGDIAANNGIFSINPANNLATVRLQWQENLARIRVGGNGAGASSGLDIQGPSDTSLLRIHGNGKIGIGTTVVPSEYMLAVDGKIITEELKVQLSTAWPDYVFLNDYKLLSLSELAQFIEKNKHLPKIPSATEVTENGIEIGEMNRLLVEKIEELTLYILEQEKRVETLENIVSSQKNKYP